MTTMNDDGTFEHECHCFGCVDELMKLSESLGKLASRIAELEKRMKGVI